MTQAANSGTIGVSDLGESYKYVAPLAQSMGLSIEDVTTALSAMSMAGIKGSQAGTSLRTVMKLKGTAVIELTDVNTSKVETYVEENMVTNAINNILGLNPMAIFYCEEDYSTGLVWTDNLLPICPNMIGGILLFPKALEENADNIYAKSDNLPVAYASNDVNSTANTARGSLNLTESKVLDNGYKFVWEFTASQGNGTIAALALTSALGGQNGYGSSVADASTFLQLKEAVL